ncbi:acyl-protein thioesterase 1 [Ephemerocybe angulata]|uniref:Acyl-protein thioesterase 1 n=1 Tax=Ephemerocybe angulata TaxID=980116 RepID=A0A8H6IEW9_9AGAR|nr:acyl-protein thioesterase 1 [Tulosesus angulatus]
MVRAVSFVREELGKLARNVRFVMPHAPSRTFTAAPELDVPSWFDIRTFKDKETREEDEESITRAAGWVHGFIDHEINENGIPAERIIVGGISQGGAVACCTLLMAEKKLGGVFILSSSAPLRGKLRELKSEMASSIPIFWAHGRQDISLRFEFALECATLLAEALGVELVISEEPSDETAKLALEKGAEEEVAGSAGLRFMGYKSLEHSFSVEELRDLSVWFRELLGKPGSSSDPGHAPGCTCVVV